MPAKKTIPLKLKQVHSLSNLNFLKRGFSSPLNKRSPSTPIVLPGSLNLKNTAEKSPTKKSKRKNREGGKDGKHKFSSVFLKLARDFSKIQIENAIKKQ